MFTISLCVFFLYPTVVLKTLRQLCTTTSILTDPALLPEEAKKAVLNPKKHSSWSSVLTLWHLKCDFKNFYPGVSGFRSLLPCGEVFALLLLKTPLKMVEMQENCLIVYFKCIHKSGQNGELYVHGQIVCFSYVQEDTNGHSIKKRVKPLLFTFIILRARQLACLRLHSFTRPVALRLRVFFFFFFSHMFGCFLYLMLLFWLFSDLLEIYPLFTQKLLHHLTNTRIETGLLKHLSAWTGAWTYETKIYTHVSVRWICCFLRWTFKGLSIGWLVFLFFWWGGLNVSHISAVHIKRPTGSI